MSENWVSNLDMLAAGGVIDFDAASYLLDKPARFVGNPKMESLPLENPSLLPDGVKLKDLPSVDEYNGKGNNKNVIENSSWKKWLFGAGIVGLAGAAIFALTGGKAKLSGLLSSVKGKFKTPSMSKFTTSVKDFGKKVFGYIKKPFTYIAKKFKK